MPHRIGAFSLNRIVKAGLLLSVAVSYFLIQAQTIPEPRFEVVSVRPSPKESSWAYKELPDGMALTGVGARVLVADAYGMELSNIVGGPSWIDTAKYDINAKFDPPVSGKLAPLPPKERVTQILSMLRPVLEERFKFKGHPETRETNVYALVLAKGGAKFSPAPALSGDAYTHEVEATFNGSTWTIRREPMSFLARQLSRIPEVGRNVIDQTGLKGDYRFTFTQPSKSDPDLSIFTALQEQLGLKLVATRSPIQVLVVDNIESPSEN